MKRPRWRAATPQIREAARAMRKEPTPAERQLWGALRGGAFAGISVRRQHTVGRFILDFYAPAQHLAIEVDGEIHDTQQERDEARTEALADLRIRVIRFRNDEVLNNLPMVLQRLRVALAPPFDEEPEI